MVKPSETITTASHPSLLCNWMKVKSHFPRTCYEIKTTYLNLNQYEWNGLFVEIFLLWVISRFQRRRKLIILSFRASGRHEIKIWTDCWMVAFLIQIIFMAAATGETEEDKNKIEPLTNGPLLTLIASLSQTKHKIINWLGLNGTRMFNY